MRTLSFNTTGTGTQFALNIEGKQYFLEKGFSKHSETFFPFLDQFLKEHNTTLSEIGCFGVVIGPGSFTGIRVGLAIVKMFAYVQSKKCITVNSLEALAYNIFKRKSDEKIICSVINAGAENLYYQLFEEKGGILEAKTQPKICNFSHFRKLLSDKLSGSAIIYCENNEQKYPFEELSLYKSEFSAEALDLSVQAKIQKGEWTDYKKITPLYIRNSQAENIIFKQENLYVTEGTRENIEDIVQLESQMDTDDLRWSRQSIEKSFENSCYKCWIIKENNKIWGYVSIMDLGEEYEVLRIVVHPKARMRGMAQRLLEALTEQAGKKGVSNIFLEVREHNYPALLLYEKMGFQIVGKRENYYHKGENALTMKKQLI